MRGVDFFIEADSLEDAIRKVAAGEFGFFETDSAEAVDFKINEKTGKENG